MGVVALQAVLVVRGGFDVHKVFGFRPFNESDTWQADIVRVTADGDRLPVDDGTWGYEWNALVGDPTLRSPWQRRHASGGADSVMDLLDRALAWVADHTPADTETVRLEATVSVSRSARPPEIHVFVTAEREEAGGP